MQVHITQQENASLQTHLAALEKQLLTAQTETDRLTATHRAVVAQHTRDNSSLRSIVAALRKDAEGAEREQRAQEQALARAGAALALAQDECKRLKHHVVQVEQTASQLKVQNRYDWWVMGSD